MNRNTDGIDIFAVRFQRANTFGHHRFGFDIATVGGDFHGIALGNAKFIRQRLPDFHKLLWLQNRVQQRVFGPVVEVLGQTIGGSDIRELIGFTQCFGVVFKDSRSRVRDNVWMQRVSSQRRFKRLVVFRERTFRHLIEGKQTPHAFLLHDKRPDAAARRRCAVVRNIPAGPLSAVPFQQLTLRIPRVTLRICGGAVIQNAAVKRPCPCPAQRVTEARRIGVITTRHLVAFRRPATGENPAATGGCTVIAQLGERTKLLAFLDDNRTGCRIGNIGQRLTVALHRHFF